MITWNIDNIGSVHIQCNHIPRTRDQLNKLSIFVYSQNK